MTQGSAGQSFIDETDTAETERGRSTTGTRPGRTATSYGRRALQSGALAGVGGSVLLLRAVRALRRGDRARGLAGLVLGAALAGTAVAQRRSGSVDQTDVVDTSPDVEDVAGGTEGDGQHAGGDAASAVAGSSVNVADAATGSQSDRDVDQTDVVEPGVDEESLDEAASEDDAGADGSTQSGGAADETDGER